MRRWRGLDEVPSDWGSCVVTIGYFDGVHRGHRVIIERAVAHARALGVPSVLITFTPHPSEIVHPGSHPAELTTQSRRGELVGALGIDVFFALPFTLDFSRLEPADFVHAILVERVKAQAVFVGDNFKFGAKAAGDVDTLRRLGPTLGFSTHGIELLAEDARPISASVIREHVATGDVRGAARLLGRPHRVDGVVERGDQRGRELGFPTANLRTDKYAAIPADGVYAGSVFQLDERGQTLGRLGTAAISVGTNPTFEGHERRVESFVLDFEGDLYGQGLGVEFVERLRGQEKYDSLADLVLQMDRDVARTRVVLS